MKTCAARKVPLLSMSKKELPVHLPPRQRRHAKSSRRLTLNYAWGKNGNSQSGFDSSFHRFHISEVCHFGQLDTISPEPESVAVATNDSFLVTVDCARSRRRLRARLAAETS